jgi:hypothetical protein
MTINRKLSGGLGVAVLVTGIGSAVAAHDAATPSTEPPVPPIAVEEFTSLNAETIVRGSFTDAVTATIDIASEGMDPVGVDIADASHVAVTRITFQPGAQASWHTPIPDQSSSRWSRANSST